MELLIG